MRFLPHCLFLLLAGLPGLGLAQTAHQEESLKVAVLSDASSEAPDPKDFGCANGYTGYIKSGEKSLAGASVFVTGTNLVLVTNGLGFFVVPASVRGWPKLTVSAMGYEPVAVTYQACEPITVDLKVKVGTKFKKHGRNKGFIVSPKRPASPAR